MVGPGIIKFHSNRGGVSFFWLKLGAGEIGIFSLMNFVSTIKDIGHYISWWVFT